MKREQLDAILQQTMAERSGGGTSWLAIGIMAVGAWLAAIPLIAFVVAGIFMATSGSDGGMWLLTITGACMLVGGMGMLLVARAHSFLEHAAAPVVAAGIACIAGSLALNLQKNLVFAVALILSIGVTCFVSRLWLRTMFGAISAGMLLGLVVMLHEFDGGIALAGHFALLAWIAAFAFVHLNLRVGDPVRAAGMEAAANGWLAVTLAILALGAGKSMLMNAYSPFLESMPLHQETAFWSPPLALVAAGVLLRAWPSLRQWWFGVVTAIAAVLAYFMPQLGAVLLILATCCATGRWRMAMVAALATAWVIGACYYQLNSSLLDKAALFAGAGIMAGAASGLAWRSARDEQGPSSGWLPRMLLAPSPSPVSQPARLWCLGLCMAAVLGVVNFTIWQKEQWIAQGQQVFVRLAPADPRSLVQGDYMALRFDLRLPDDDMSWSTMENPQIVMRKNRDGIAQPMRLSRRAESLAEDELLMNLAYKHGVRTVGTDAWYFTEGEAARYAGAQYGEFRVHDGRAVLVGMRGENLKPL